MKQENMKNHRIYKMSVASVYPFYVAKAEKKGRTKQEVDEIIRWLTGYSQEELETELKKMNLLKFGKKLNSVIRENLDFILLITVIGGLTLNRGLY